MRLLQFLNEMKDPSVLDILKTYKDDPDIYVHFTNMEKIGINPKQEYPTPLGIYAYPLKYIWKEMLNDNVPYMGRAKNIYILKPSKKNTILNVKSYTKRDLEKDIEKLRILFKNNENLEFIIEINNDNKDSFHPYLNLESIVRDLSNEFKQVRISKMSSIFKKLGYSGILDLGTGYIYRNELYQIVFFDIKGFKVISSLRNKETTVTITSFKEIYDMYKDSGRDGLYELANIMIRSILSRRKKFIRTYSAYHRYIIDTTKLSKNDEYLKKIVDLIINDIKNNKYMLEPFIDSYKKYIES